MNLAKIYVFLVCVPLICTQVHAQEIRTLEPGKPADFFTLDLDDPSIAGLSAEALLPGILFASSRAAVREVIVGGKPIVSEGRHLIQEEVVERFNELQRRLWS